MRDTRHTLQTRLALSADAFLSRVHSYKRAGGRTKGRAAGTWQTARVAVELVESGDDRARGESKQVDRCRERRLGPSYGLSLGARTFPSFRKELHIEHTFLPRAVATYVVDDSGDCTKSGKVQTFLASPRCSPESEDGSPQQIMASDMITKLNFTFNAGPRERVETRKV